MDEGRPPDPEPADDDRDAVAAEFGPAGFGPDRGPDDAEQSAAEFPPEDVPLEPRGPSRALIGMTVVVIAALVVFAVLGGRISPPNTLPAQGIEPRLAVTDADGRLYTMARDGGATTEYALSGIRFGFPAWSPDGTRIAITGEGDEGVRLYLFDVAAEGGGAGGDAEPAVLYDDSEHPPFYLYWSPDGRQLAFLTSEPDGIALRLVSADGNAEARIVREGSPLYWDWLGNDHLVAHIGSSGGDAFLGEVDLQGASTEAVPLQPGFFRSPAVSRDGAFRAYVTSGQDSTGMVTVESIDRASRRAASVLGVAAVSFDPTGSTLAYVASEQRSADDLAFPLGPLKLLDPASGATRALLGGEVVAFFWSPDGKTMAALMLNPPDEEIVGVSGAGLASTTGTAPGAADDPPPPAQGVPLTLTFVDVATGSIRGTRSVEITSRYVNNILPYFDQYNLSHRTWSPDSSAIALPLVIDGKDQLAVIPADGSLMTPLANAELGFWSP